MGGDYGGGGGTGGIYIPPNILGKKCFGAEDLGCLGGENWRKGVKKEGRQLRRCLTERSTDVSFPKKGRQIFVSPIGPPNFRDKSPPLLRST
jgi:hypothetical protein